MGNNLNLIYRKQGAQLNSFNIAYFRNRFMEEI